MDAKIKSLFKTIAVIFIVFSIVTGVFAALAYSTEFELPIGHFKFGAVFAPIFKVMAVVCVVAAIAVSVYFNFKSVMVSPRPMNAAVIFTCAMTGAMMIVFSILDLINIMGDSEATTMLFARNIIGIPTGVCFIMCALADPKKLFKNTLFAFISFLPVIWSVLSLLLFYFDSSYALNSPIRISVQLMFVSIMLFLPHDCRFILGKVKTGAYIFTGFCAVVFTGITAFSGIASCLVSEVKAFPFTLPEAFLYLSLWGYSVTRILSASKVMLKYVPPKKETKEEALLRELEKISKRRLK